MQQRALLYRVNGAYTLYSNLPTALPRAVQMQAVSNGADHWQRLHGAH